MTTARDIVIYQGQAFALSLPYAGTAGRGQRMHIRTATATATVVQILTHNGDANARVIFDGTDAIDVTIGASFSGLWLVGSDRVEWVYDIEDYSLADDDDVVITHRGKCIVYGNRTRAEDVTPSAQMPSGDGRYVRFDTDAQGLSDAQKLAARTNIGAGSGGSGSGDVVGPESATDDALAVFDGTTGKLLAESTVTGAAVALHLSSTSNPHSVTAAQVGADAAGTAATAVAALAATLGDAAVLAVGTTAGTVAAGDDSRLSDARTPTAHATSHAPGGSDALAWTTIHGRGVAASRPAAAAGNAGYIYYSTDTQALERSTGSAWESIAAAGGAAWGGITGTLSSQSDLTAALALKAPIASPTFTGTVSAPFFGAGGANAGGMVFTSGYTILKNYGGTDKFSTNTGAGFCIAVGGLSFGPDYYTASASITYDAANILNIRSGTSAQALRVSGTHTDASNYVRGSLAATSTAVTLTAETAGTGADNVPLTITAGGTSHVISGSPLRLPSFTVATLPSAATAAAMIYVSDETGGAVLAFSDGTNWRRVTDRAIVA